jgi:hypothetical protein
MEHNVEYELVQKSHSDNTQYCTQGKPHKRLESVWYQRPHNDYTLYCIGDLIVARFCISFNTKGTLSAVAVLLALV